MLDQNIRDCRVIDFFFSKNLSSFRTGELHEMLPETIHCLEKKNISFSSLSDYVMKVLKNPAVFLALYVIVFTCLCHGIRKCRVNFLTLFLFVLILVGLIWVILKFDCPRVHALSITIVAALTTNYFTELFHENGMQKEDSLLTLHSNMIVLALFILGAFELRFTRHYLIFITALGELFAIAQFYSNLFRGCPLRPTDFESVLSALEIASSYSLIHPKGLAYSALAVFNVICLWHFTFKCGLLDSPRIIRIAIRIFGFVLIGYFIFRSDAVAHSCSRKVVRFDLVRTYRMLGYFLGFFVDYKLFSVDHRPPGYDVKKVKEILEKFAPKQPVNTSMLRKPNILVILSESFSDYSLFGDLSLNEDYMPFIRSLRNNTVKGYVSVSAHGGLTCNSEYEFFTGNNMGFYSYGTAAYSGLVNTKQESITYIMNDMGYDTISFAATSRSMWNIGSVYKKLKFKKSYYINQFYDKNDVFNGWPTDRTLFKGVETVYANRTRDNPDKPLFMFLATMQNHGQYSEIPDPTVFSKKYKNFAQLSSYFTGLKLTDNAVKDLVDYFSEVKEDVVIVFFGDHHPNIPGFYRRHFGKEWNRVESRALTQITPFFIWANYKIEEEKCNLTLSYLSSKLMDVIGFPKTAYMNFLEDTKKHIPFITPFSYMDANGTWHERDNGNSDENFYLDRYFQVQYYMINHR